MIELPYLVFSEVEFDRAHHLQKALVDWIGQNDFPGVLLLLEHPPVITLGKSASPANLLVREEVLTQAGIELRPVERGGDITYHGPGQIVGYPLLNLRFWEKDVHLFLRTLEEALITFLRRYQVEAMRYPPFTGVWVRNRGSFEKIAAIGVAVKRWVTYHGFALNISPNLDHFRYIIPCGIKDKGVTSLEEMKAETFSSSEREFMKKEIAQDLGAVFGFSMVALREKNINQFGREIRTILQEIVEKLRMEVKR
ncbi:MAG: lipoyl(octanoyl) transferase [Candidatus Atribacteria bacterium]|nr:lipoyl(octanoyl) transferase [Candidatus Atribacteria bacterium]